MYNISSTLSHFIYVCIENISLYWNEIPNESSQILYKFNITFDQESSQIPNEILQFSDFDLLTRKKCFLCSSFWFALDFFLRGLVVIQQYLKSIWIDDLTYKLPLLALAYSILNETDKSYALPFIYLLLIINIVKLS